MIGCEQEDNQIEVNYQKGDGRMNFYDIFKYVRETCRKIVPLSLNDQILLMQSDCLLINPKILLQSVLLINICIHHLLTI